MMTMMFTPRRAVLGELSSIPLTARAINTDANIDMVPESFLTPSPEEHIIRQRSVQRVGTPVSQLKDAENSDTPFKGSLAGLSLSRKRLILSPPQASSSPLKDSLCRLDGPRPKRCRRRKAYSVPLATELKGYTPQQLADIIDRIVSSHPELEEEVRLSLPPPDILPLEDRLDTLHHNVFRALPSARWGSSRDAYTYHRVKGHIDVFKRVCVDQGRVLVNAQCWEAVFRYVLSGWRYVSQLPVWDDPSHNQAKTSCFKHLAAQCMVALKKATLEKETLRALRQKLHVATQINTEMQPCVNYIDRTLTKLS